MRQSILPKFTYALAIGVRESARQTVSHRHCASNQMVRATADDRRASRSHKPSRTSRQFIAKVVPKKAQRMGHELRILLKINVESAVYQGGLNDPGFGIVRNSPVRRKRRPLCGFRNVGSGRSGQSPQATDCDACMTCVDQQPC